MSRHAPPIANIPKIHFLLLLVLVVLGAYGVEDASIAQDSTQNRKYAYHWSENLTVAPPEQGKQRGETALTTDKSGVIWLTYLDADYKKLPTGTWIAWPRRVMLLSSSDQGKSFGDQVTLSEMGGDEAVRAGLRGNIYASWVQYTYDDSRRLQQEIVVRELNNSNQTSDLVKCLDWSPGTRHDQSSVYVANDGKVYVLGVDITVRNGSESREVLFGESSDNLRTCASRHHLPAVGELPQIVATTSGLIIAGARGYITSQDGGQSFAEQKPYRFGDKLARIAVSPEGRTAYVAGDAAQGGLWINATDDGGKTWRKARVDSGAHASAWRYPAVAVSTSGRVHVIWIDDRAGYGGVYHAYSDDRGQTFSENVRISDRPFAFPASAPEPPPATQNGTWIGDYLSLTTIGDSVVAAWSDQRAGVPLSAIYSAVGLMQVAP